jgi:UDP-GlcNAc:polypeptide alpha-N-acetylglucosaminyltransferase
MPHVTTPAFSPATAACALTLALALAFVVPVAALSREFGAAKQVADPFANDHGRLGGGERAYLAGAKPSAQHPALFGGNEVWTATDDRTIFISAATFRDAECPITMTEIYSKAANPRRVFVGIIEQNEPSDPVCVPAEFYQCSFDADRPTAFCPLDNIRRRRVASMRGHGPCYGRYHAMLMYRHEAYFMMIDSHNLFLRNWDRLTTAQLRLTRSGRPVLSHYPNTWDKVNRTLESQTAVMVMCNGHYLDYLGYIRMDASWMSVRREPRHQPFSAGGYLVGDAMLIHDVPFDPYLPFLFDGEEILYSARTYTHGYDLFTPGISLLFHDYARHKAIRYWSVQAEIKDGPNWHHITSHSQQRVRYMLEVHKPNKTEQWVPRDTKEEEVIVEIGKYGMGLNRTMKEYYHFARVDPVHYKGGSAYCESLTRKDGVF